MWNSIKSITADIVNGAPPTAEGDDEEEAEEANEYSVHHHHQQQQQQPPHQSSHPPAPHHQEEESRREDNTSDKKQPTPSSGGSLPLHQLPPTAKSTDESQVRASSSGSTTPTTITATARELAAYEEAVRSLEKERVTLVNDKKQLRLDLEREHQLVEATKKQLHDYAAEAHKAHHATVAHFESRIQKSTDSLRLEHATALEEAKLSHQSEVDRLTKQLADAQLAIGVNGSSATNATTDQISRMEHSMRQAEQRERSAFAERDAIRQDLSDKLSVQKETAVELKRQLEEAMLQLAEMMQQRQTDNAESLRTMLNETRSELERTTLELKKAREEAKNISSASADITLLEAETQRLRRELQLVRDQNTATTQKLKSDLEQSRMHCATFQSQAERASKDLTEFVKRNEKTEKSLLETQAALERTGSERDELQRRLSNLERDKDSERRRNELDGNRVSVLESRNQELDDERTKLRDAVNAIQILCIEALKRSQVQLPPGPVPPPRDLVLCLCGELEKARTKNVENERLLTQWSDAYEKAKIANNDARRVLMDTQERLALAEANVQRLSGNHTDAERRADDLTFLANSRETKILELQERIEKLERDAQLRNETDMSATALLQEFQEERESFRHHILEKESELNDARKSVENLQSVISSLQKQKRADIDEHTHYLNYEIDKLKEQLLHSQEEKTSRRNEMDQMQTIHRKELVSKNGIIASQQQKLSDMRKALEETVLRLNDETMIDKRIVSHLLINYINSVAFQRSDKEDIVRVMSGLLSWDEDHMQRAGLCPGPKNPFDQQVAAKGEHGGGVRGALSSLLWGGSRQRSDDAKITDGKTASAPSSGKNGLAQMWVDFLIKETERIRTQTNEHAPESNATPTADPHGGDDVANDADPR